MDTPPWDRDPEVFTPTAIPGKKEDDNFVCDCGDIARAALAANSVDKRVETTAIEATSYDFGYFAFRRGIHKHENPYNFQSDNWYNWRNGWEDGELEKQSIDERLERKT